MSVRTEAAPLVGEDLAIDFVNTTVQSPDGPIDVIATPDGLTAWLLAEDGRVPAVDVPIDEAAVTQVRALRADIATVLAHLRRGTEPPERALRTINRAARSAIPYRELMWTGEQLTWHTGWTGTAAARLCAHLADAAIDFLSRTDPATIRQCAAPDCVMLFVPAHPRRQWCSPACGNRVRVTRYYHRHKRP